jgi:hypothetical protein
MIGNKIYLFGDLLSFQPLLNKLGAFRPHYAENVKKRFEDPSARYLRNGALPPNVQP